MVINPRIPPSVTFPSPNEYPNTLLPISGIANGLTTNVNVIAHGFVQQDVGVTTVIFLQVRGMIQINGLPGRIIQIVDPNHFMVDINSTNFYSYSGGGVISIVTGHPPSQTQSFQTFNTPFQNVA